MGVVYDSVHDNLYEAVKGGGVTLNGAPLPRFTGGENDAKPTTWFADRSLPTYPYFAAVEAHFEVCFVGGAVMNALQLLTEPNSVYVKATKKAVSGCAIWDLAAVALMVEEHLGGVRTYDGGVLHLNRAETVFFNDVGFAFTSADVDIDGFLPRLQDIVSQM